jgi:crotonobetainyl-CoA:carnitine CoA-transferase CaiB-like acyl-CoA transferase
MSNPRDVATDEQAIINGYFQPVTYESGHTLPLVAAAAQFDQEPASLTRGPEHAEHTEEVLLEYGYDWDDLIRLKESGAIS